MGGLGSNPKEYRHFEQNLVFVFFRSQVVLLHIFIFDP